MQAKSAPDDDPSADALRSRLSCLIDGHSDGGNHALGAEEACAGWRVDAHWRRTWHRYHLIGDVMRSSELASAPERDAAFLARLRERLALEPPLLAPAVLPMSPMAGPKPHAWRHRWVTSAAVAAGFVAVAGTVVVVRTSQQETTAPASNLASSTPNTAATAGMRASAQGSSAPAALAAPDAAMVRDAEIDRYFRAHRGMAVSPAAAMPGGAPRNVDTILPQR